MTAITGLTGLRPTPDHVTHVCAPPYDVIKPGSPLATRLGQEPLSITQVTLGDDPAAALAALRSHGALITDDEPCYYVYEQRWNNEVRVGFFAAVAVSDYPAGQIIRHEKTFDDKVRGRIALATATGHTTGPAFLLTAAPLADAWAAIMASAPCYAFTSDFGPGTDLSGITNRIWRVPADSPAGRGLAGMVAEPPLYIADGHHRYHAALRSGQTHTLAYITDGARILAYNRVIRGPTPFATIAERLDLRPVEHFSTPPKHHFCLYSGGRSWLLPAATVPEDVVGRLDCSILERELYPLLGLRHDMIMNQTHFDYYPEYALNSMRAAVDDGRYDLAVALAPVDLSELMAVADAGLEDPDVVMPEKSTFFAPKILSGLFLYQHRHRED